MKRFLKECVLPFLAIPVGIVGAILVIFLAIKCAGWLLDIIAIFF